MNILSFEGMSTHFQYASHEFTYQEIDLRVKRPIHVMENLDSDFVFAPNGHHYRKIQWELRWR